LRDNDVAERFNFNDRTGSITSGKNGKRLTRPVNGKLPATVLEAVDSEEAPAITSVKINSIILEAISAQSKGR
jgi:hypothetical protein